MSGPSLRIGVLGASPGSRVDLLPALRQQRRIRITCLHSFAVDVGEKLAHEVGARLVTGVDALARREDVDALVVDPCWSGWEVLTLISRHHKPTLIVTDGFSDAAYLNIQRVAGVSTGAAEQGTLLMPGLRNRWHPVTIRLRELIATSLGAVEELVLTGPPVSLASRSCAERIDWCYALIQSAVTGVAVTRSSDQESVILRIQFRRRRADGTPISATLPVVLNAPPSTGNEAAPLRAVLTCRSGLVEIQDQDRLVYRVRGASREESLQEDRPCTELMVDLFARRALGGLVPVPDLNDVKTSLRIVEAAQRSLAAGGTECSLDT